MSNLLKLRFRVWFSFLLVLISYSSFGQKMADYQESAIEGFEIYIENSVLIDHPEEAQEVLRLLTIQLDRISSLRLKPEILDTLKSIKIFIEWTTATGSAHYHRDLNWIIRNDYLAQKWRSIEIFNIPSFINWAEEIQPFLMMHELAHAYHHITEAEYGALIKNAYENTIEQALHDSVTYNIGNGNTTIEMSYAKVSHLEYFAELTEAYLGVNEAFPHTRRQLQEYDSVGYNMVKEIWLLEDR